MKRNGVLEAAAAAALVLAGCTPPQRSADAHPTGSPTAPTHRYGAGYAGGGHAGASDDAARHGDDEAPHGGDDDDSSGHGFGHAGADGSGG